jgi:hypothetical protein
MDSKNNMINKIIMKVNYHLYWMYVIISIEYIYIYILIINLDWSWIIKINESWRYKIKNQ